MKRKMMETANIWLPAIGTMLLGGFAVGAWYGGNRVHALWYGFFGLIFLLLLIALQLQGVLRESDVPKGPTATEMAANRAYVGFGNLTAVLLDSPSPGRVTAWIRITNTGKTPALKTKGWLLFKVDLTDKLPFAESRSFDNESTMAPGYEANLYNTKEFPADALPAIESGQISFFVWGRVEYEDVYGRPHFHDFQGRMNGPAQTIITEGREARGWGFNPFGTGTKSD